MIDTGPRVDSKYHTVGNEVALSFGNAPHILGLRQIDSDKLIYILTVTP